MKETKRKLSCPEGWLPAGAKVPIRLNKSQEDYCRRAEGVRHRWEPTADSVTNSTRSLTEVAS